MTRPDGFHSISSRATTPTPRNYYTRGAPMQVNKEEIALLVPEGLRKTNGDYRHVYPDVDVNAYVAWVGDGFRLGSFPNPSYAAQAVVDWYKATYGDKWRDVIANRKRKSVVISARNGGWYGAVYLFGERVEISRWHRKKIVTQFPTRTAIEEHIDEFLKKVLGEMCFPMRRIFLYRVRPNDKGSEKIYSVNVEPVKVREKAVKASIPSAPRGELLPTRTIDELLANADSPITS